MSQRGKSDHDVPRPGLPEQPRAPSGASPGADESLRPFSSLRASAGEPASRQWSPDSRPSDLSRIRMTRIGQRIVAAPRVPWWGRLESRVITALVCLGILCVGASAYLVALTVQYFEGIVGSATQKSDDAVALSLPFYDGYVKAR
jgi:hypothetical protein